MYPGESISLKTPHYMYIILIESCNITKYNAYHKQSSTMPFCYTQYSSDLISKSIPLLACLCCSIPAQELMRMASQTHFSLANSHSHNVGREHKLQFSIFAPSYNTGQIREQTHWHTQSLYHARSHAQLWSQLIAI